MDQKQYFTNNSRTKSGDTYNVSIKCVITF